MKFNCYSENCDIFIVFIDAFGNEYILSDSFDTEFVARSVATSINEGVCNRTRSIRLIAYNRGKRAVRNKELRVEEFNDCINSSEVGW